MRGERSEATTVLGAVLRRRGVVIATVLAAVLLTGIASLLQVPRFRAEAVVLVRSSPDLTGTGDFVATNRLANEVTLATSAAVLDRLQAEFGRVRVDVESDQQASVLRFVVEHPDPVVAVAVADRHADLYLQARLDGQVTAYLASADVIRARLEELEAELAALEVRYLAERAGAADARLVDDRFGAERASLESQRRRYLEALDDVSLSAELAATGGAAIVNRALLPRSADSPRPLQNLALALAGGLALGAGLALGLELLDDRIRTRADVKDDGGVPLLATVPRVAAWRQRRQAHLVTRTASRSPASEAYRSLGTSLAFLRIEQPMTVVQVTSPLSGDGKTTTAANLAVALARAGGERVLLLDADLLLDTSPYGSGATAVTALAAGLPLLTCPGDTFASRMGASLCAATGLEELICSTPEAYQQRAIALGCQPAELQRLRRQLLARHRELPLFNTAAWVGHLEALLERLLVVEPEHPDTRDAH